MAFLVEHVNLNNSQRSDDAIDNARSSPVRGTRITATRFLRRNNSSVTSKNGSSSASETVPTSSPTTETERRPSLTTSISSRLRRRRTKTSDGIPALDNHSASQLGQLFFALPSEILTQIICCLTIHDVYALRQVCRSLHSIINANAFVISRHVLSRTLPEQVVAHAFSLYAIPSPCDDLQYLLRMQHRQHRIDKAIYHTLSFAQVKIYTFNRDAFSPLARSSPYRQYLEEALQQPTWTAYHFLERYRDLVTSDHDEQHREGQGRFWDCQTCATKAQALVDSYPSRDVMPVFHFLQLLVLHFQTATRLPTSLGPLDRKLKSKKHASDEDISIFVFLGGLEEMSKINVMQGSFQKRMQIINNFVSPVRTAVEANQARGKVSSTHTISSNEQRRSTTSEQDILPSSSSTDSRAERAAAAATTTTATTDSNPIQSLSPSLSMLTQDHLDRLPNLHEFLLPIWLRRIEKENLHAKHPEDLDNPFNWVSRVLFQEQDDDDDDDPPVQDETSTVMTGIEGGEAQTTTATTIQNDQIHDQQQLQQQQQISTVQNSTRLFSSHAPTTLMPIFGASPV